MIPDLDLAIITGDRLGSVLQTRLCPVSAAAGRTLPSSPRRPSVLLPCHFCCRLSAAVTVDSNEMSNHLKAFLSKPFSSSLTLLSLFSHFLPPRPPPPPPVCPANKRERTRHNKSSINLSLTLAKFSPSPIPSTPATMTTDDDELWQYASVSLATLSFTNRQRHTARCPVRHFISSPFSQSLSVVKLHFDLPDHPRSGSDRSRPLALTP